MVVGSVVVMTVAGVVAVVVVMGVAGFVTVPAERRDEEPDTDEGDEPAGDDAEVAQHPAAGERRRCRQGETEREDTGGVRRGDRRADDDGVARRAAPAGEV